MTAHIHLKWLNSAYLKVVTEPQVLMDLHTYLTFYAKNWKYHPKVKKGFWDGKIQVLNKFDGSTYAGLARHIKKFCEDRGLTITWDSEFDYIDVTPKQVYDFIQQLELPEAIKTTKEYEHQIEAVWKGIRSGRRTLEVGTSGGKSLIAYILQQWYDQKTLIVVPTVQLVEQFEGDLRDYGFMGKIHTSIGGLSKDEDIDAEIVITTWQAVTNGKKKPSPQWFEQFRVVFGDEAHECAAPSLINLMTNMTHTVGRFGLTGSMPDHALTRATIEGLFGPHHFVIDARGLIERGVSADFRVVRLVFKHPPHICEMMKKNAYAKGKSSAQKYKEEYDFIVNCKKRTLAIAKLACKLEGNKIIFFRTRDHGDMLNRATKAVDPNAKVLYIDGRVKGSKRNDMREQIEDAEDSILIASLGTTKRGVNIKKLHQAIMASFTKSVTDVVQTIGRMLRKHDTKDVAVMYDIVDDMSVGSWKNFLLRHSIDRAEVYKKERHPVKTIEVELDYE